MSFPTGEEKHEIIIVKRGHDDEHGHHGGVWKIAFADFMTAMMCFFLVMWLINAANEQTKASVASYFNPVRLIDRNSSRKGLEDIGDGPNSVGASEENVQETQGKAASDGQSNGGPRDETHSADTSESAVHSDEHLFADPYAVLAEIVSDTGTQANVSAKGDGGAQAAGPATGASGGESYRDPFAPDFWTQQVAGNETAEGSKGEGEGDVTAEGTDPAGGKGSQGVDPDNAGDADPTDTAESTDPADPVETARAEVELERTAALSPDPLAAETETPTEMPAELLPTPADRETVAEPTPVETPAPEAATPAPEPLPRPETGPSEEAVREAAEIRRELARAFGNERILEGISVVPTDRGVVISVTDQIDFGMFEIGSAVPRRETILAMEKIARTLEGRKGTLRIDGHTDARPFKSGTYDNWRLSTARAHAAYYMLVRAGVDERRITEVGGMADRKPKAGTDPLAATNRRIEILLEVAG